MNEPILGCEAFEADFPNSKGWCCGGCHTGGKPSYLNGQWSNAGKAFKIKNGKEYYLCCEKEMFAILNNLLCEGQEIGWRKEQIEERKLEMKEE